MALRAKLRVTVTLQPSGKSSVLIVQTLEDLLRQCSSKFRVKTRRVFLATTGEELLTDFSGILNDTKLIVTCGDTYTIPNIPLNVTIDPSLVSIRIIACRTLVEQAAIDQVNNVARIYPQVKHIWGIDKNDHFLLSFVIVC